MRQILVMMAAVVLVGCGNKTPETSQSVEAEAQVASKPTPEPTPVSPADEKLIVEKAVRKKLKKPEGELTEADLENVTVHALDFTKITDAGLKNVARLENVQDLWLLNTSITDVGLKEVAKMKQLKSVSMFTGGGAPWTHGAETRATFTRAGMAELRKALPNCRFNP